MNNDRLYERYQRQLILKGFGAEAQQKLLAAFVLVIGAGGLGCPVLQYLTAAGVGSRPPESRRIAEVLKYRRPRKRRA